MDQGTVLAWLKLLHVLAAFGFVAMHGTSIYVLVRLRRERDVASVRALLNLSIASLIPAYAFLALILVSGIASGIVGGWWTSGRLWIWASLAVLVAVFLYMSFAATGYFARLRAAAGLEYQVRGRKVPASAPDEAALAAALNGPNPTAAILTVGGLGLVVLVWLMVMKPF